MPKSVYIHIPFCKSKCKYCSFVSFVNQKHNEYIEALLNEINFYYQNEVVNTLYFGGGTPSLISAQNIEKILNKFNINKDTEVTMELNPDDVTEEYLTKLKEIGINRLSMGAQSFNNDILKIIGRRHTAETTISSVKLAQKVGFKNISLDLIYGLPTQTQKELNRDLEIISGLGIQHVSTYGLKIEEGSYFGLHLPQNLPDDDTQADFYEGVNKFLEARGFKRYEISNFALEGFESRHNLNYWNNEEYYGFGVAAHGYKGQMRYFNTASLQMYLHNPIKHESEHNLPLKEQLEEEIFLGFRKTSGINTDKIKVKFCIDFEKEYAHVLQKYTPEYIERTPLGFKLTTKGVLLSNLILSEFI